jgi:hypothetical protein
VSSCRNVLTGTNINGILSCVSNAAPSPGPRALPALQLFGSRSDRRQ